MSNPDTQTEVKPLNTLVEPAGMFFMILDVTYDHLNHFERNL